MFDLHERMQETAFLVTTRRCEVCVLAARGWWRRLLKCESWAIAYKTREGVFNVISPTGGQVNRYGHMREIKNSDLWPDNVCAEVARLKFIL